MSRPDWDEYFAAMVPAVGSRGTCDRGKSGAIFTKDQRIVATGYVGAPPGFPHCDQEGHQMALVTFGKTVERSCVRTVHAEQNAILDAARRGVPLLGTTLYCTMEPCRNCAMSLVTVGCARVVALWKYGKAEHSRGMLAAAGIPLHVLNDEEAHYG